MLSVFWQITQRLNTNKTFTRMSTLKLKRSLTKKLSGRTEQKRKLKSSRSIKLASVKGTKSATKLYSESIYGSDGKNRKSTSDASGNKSQRVMTRRLSLRPVRISTKKSSCKSNDSFEDLSLHKATCSSTLKDSHFPDHIDLPQEGSGSQGVSAKKVCPYTYCSLHGHRHNGDLPPLKRFVSMRRRQLKSQKSMKKDGRSKHIGNARKNDTQKTKIVHSEDGNSHFQDVKKLARESSSFKSHDMAAYDEVIERARNDNRNMAAYKENDEVANVESTSTTDVVDFPVSDIKISEVELTTEGKIIEPDYEVLQKSFVPEEPKPDSSTTDVAYGLKERDQKYIKKWHLMYKHAVLSNTGKCEKKPPFFGKDKEDSDEDALAFNGGNNSSCESDQDMDDEKKNVIELVQKAFDEILLPEVEDLSFDDRSKSRGIGADEVLLGKSDGKTEEMNTTAFTESPKEAQKMENTPKSWGHLKKLILLKRFVKALEKVRNINPRRPTQFPSDTNFGAEKVSLNRQTSEERKKSEEWMLDYALQKVISKLAPAQRQRVTLLIEAFETILPTQDAENRQQSFATVESRENPIQSLDASSNHNNRTDSVYSTKTLLQKVSRSNDSTMEFSDKATDTSMPELCNPIELKERSLDYPRTKTVKNMPASSGSTEEDLKGKLLVASSYDNGEKISTVNENSYHVEIEDSRSVETRSRCREEAPSNQIADEVSEVLVSDLNTENPSIKCESPGRDCETKNVIGDNSEQFSVTKGLVLNGLVRSLRSNLVGPKPEATSNLLDEPTRDTKDMIGKDQFETNEATRSDFGEPESQVEKQGNSGLWYMVYKHMVSDMTENNSKTLSDVEDEKESNFEGSITRETSVSYETTPVINQDMNFKDHIVADREVELRQIEAIKMVEEAIDSILPDFQDHLPDQQPLTDNTISNNSKEIGRTERMDSEGLNQKEEKLEFGNGIAQEQKEESASKEGDKPKQQMSRSWSNLKKVILLRRFIKALEKVRKFNPRGPRYLPVEPDSESEKVRLRHQDMAERKGTEEWMLDYALRQVVSKLTPARKRKVELLVEAFETVVPTIKN